MLSRVAFLVGASEGIGLAVAERLVARGADVVIGSRTPTKLEAAAARLEGHRIRPDQVIATHPIDVTDTASIAAFIEAALAAAGPPDLLIETAGISLPGWLDDLTDDDVRTMVDLNLVGTINVTRAVLPHLANGAQIVLSSSMAGLVGVYGHAVYCATKFGVVGFAEALRRELAPRHIQVKVICPPNTLTPGFEIENRRKPDEVLAAEESVRTLSADEVADDVVRSLGRRRKVILSRGSRLAAHAIRHLPAIVDLTLRRKG